jgi:hypothetical protein
VRREARRRRPRVTVICKIRVVRNRDRRIKRHHKPRLGAESCDPSTRLLQVTVTGSVLDFVILCSRPPAPEAAAAARAYATALRSHRAYLSGLTSDTQGSWLEIGTELDESLLSMCNFATSVDSLADFRENHNMPACCSFFLCSHSIIDTSGHFYASTFLTIADRRRASVMVTASSVRMVRLP